MDWHRAMGEESVFRSDELSIVDCLIVNNVTDGRGSEKCVVCYDAL